MSKYGPTAQKKVQKAVRDYKEGKLKGVNPDRPIISRQQALAIGLSGTETTAEKTPHYSNGSN
jgi:hypothetical protein